MLNAKLSSPYSLAQGIGAKIKEGEYYALRPPKGEQPKYLVINKGVWRPVGYKKFAKNCPGAANKRVAY